MDVKKIKEESLHVLSILQQVEIKNKKGIPVDSDVRRCEEVQAKIDGIATGLNNRFNAALASLVLVWAAVYAFGR
ncbi:hypothetical protein EON65_31385 [archaeon]|nr:MAG: hypothetical protein EON65_31385 [archaeon]